MMQWLFFPPLNRTRLKYIYLKVISYNISVPFLHLQFCFECKTPCKTIEIKSILVRKQASSIHNRWRIMFEPVVIITRSSPAMNLMTLRANIGGCLCITLGCSILQMATQFGWRKIKFNYLNLGGRSQTYNIVLNLIWSVNGSLSHHRVMT